MEAIERVVIAWSGMIECSMRLERCRRGLGSWSVSLIWAWSWKNRYITFECLMGHSM